MISGMKVARMGLIPGFDIKTLILILVFCVSALLQAYESRMSTGGGRTFSSFYTTQDQIPAIAVAMIPTASPYSSILDCVMRATSVRVSFSCLVWVSRRSDHPFQARLCAFQSFRYNIARTSALLVVTGCMILIPASCMIPVHTSPCYQYSSQLSFPDPAL